MIKKRLIGLLAHAKKYVFFNVLFQWLGLVSQIFIVWSITTVLGYAYSCATGNAAMNSAPDSVVLTPAVATFFICLILRHVLDRLAANASFHASVDVKRILRERIYDKLLRLSVSYREKISTAEVVQLATEGVEQLETYFGRYLSQFFYSLLAPVTLFAYFITMDVKVALVLLLCVPLIPMSIVVVQKTAKKLLGKYWDAYANLGDSFLENLQGLTTLKIYRADEKKAREMDAEAEHFRKITMKVLTMQLNSTSVMDIMAYGAAAVGMILALSDFRNDRITLTQTLTMILLAAEFFLPLRVLGSFFHIAMNGMAASDKVFRLLDLEEPEDFPVTGISKAGAATAGHKAGIFLQDVHFSYEEGTEALKGVDLMLPQGAFVALVGVSGCGKSTIANLLTGRNHGYTGDIRIDGRPLNRTATKDLMQMITLVRSDSPLFKGTVEENLRMGKPDATEHELHAVLRRVQLDDYLKTLDGLQTAVSEGGANFSGGQRQRLALARALLHDTPYYIFDEATSGIDYESEEKIMEVIRSLAGEKTILLITHRLANVTGADAVYMMQQGAVIENGTHALLVGREGAYGRLYAAQTELERYAGFGQASGMQRTRVQTGEVTV